MEQVETISVRLFGGLGNQIFQYMAGKSLASDRNLLLHVDTSWLQDGYRHSNSSISEFHFYAPDREYGDKHKGTLHLYLDRLTTIAARNFKLVSKFAKINVPRSVGFEDFGSVKSGAQLRGYYQSPRYFFKLMESGEISRDSFELNNPSESFNTRINQIPNQGFMAVHVRGGDYLKKHTTYIQMTSDYYKEAIGYLRNRCGDLPIWVFTDDLDHATKILSSFSGLYFMDNKVITAAEAMKIMSKAKGIVCANSTFSYWASIISNSETLIVAPKYWMKLSEQPVDFFPKDWKLI